MKIQLGLVMFTTCVAIVFGNVCNIGFGKLGNSDSQLYTLHARSGPVVEPRNMSLVFDYRVSPVENIEITYVNVTASLPDGCTFSQGGFQDQTKGFNIKVSSLRPVNELYGSAVVYGVNFGN